MGDLKLCYVDNCWAYFTSQSLVDQTGDDWDDAPYEYNAGEPYGPREDEDWEILKMAFDGAFWEPKDFYCNFPYYSVDMINNDKMWWLSSMSSEDKLFAGSTYCEFVEFIQKNDGHVYICVGFDFGKYDEDLNVKSSD